MWHPPYQTTTLVPKTNGGTEGREGDEGRGTIFLYFVFFFNCLFILVYIYGPKYYDDYFNFPNDGEPVICQNPPP